MKSAERKDLFYREFKDLLKKHGAVLEEDISDGSNHHGIAVVMPPVWDGEFLEKEFASFLLMDYDKY